MTEATNDAASPATDNTDLEMTTEIVAAYVSNNSVPLADLAALIHSVHAAVSGLGKAARPTPAAEPLQPAVSVRKSVTQDYIVCLENGKRFKSLKRHLQTTFGLTPAQYRAKWGLPADYPMVAPGYAAARSELAKGMGLGRKAGETNAVREATAQAAQAPVAQAPEAFPVPGEAFGPVRRGRRPKVIQDAA